MSWQNVLLGVVSVGFSIALVPAIIKHQGPPLFSCMTTAVGLTAIVVCYLTLGGLGFAAITTASTAVLWWVLTWQDINATRQTKKVLAILQRRFYA